VNAYFYSFGERKYVAEVIADNPRYETAELCGVVIAATRGKARVFAVAYENRHASIAWTDMRSLRKLCYDANGEPRVVEVGDPEYARLWSLASQPEGDDTNGRATADVRG